MIETFEGGGGKDIKELTVVQVVGVVGVDDNGLIGGNLGVVTLDLGVSWDLRQQLIHHIRAGLKVSVWILTCSMGSEMPLSCT